MASSPKARAERLLLGITATPCRPGLLGPNGAYPEESLRQALLQDYTQLYTLTQDNQQISQANDTDNYWSLWAAHRELMNRFQADPASSPALSQTKQIRCWATSLLWMQKGTGWLLELTGIPSDNAPPSIRMMASRATQAALSGLHGPADRFPADTFQAPFQQLLHQLLEIDRRRAVSYLGLYSTIAPQLKVTPSMLPGWGKALSAALLGAHKNWTEHERSNRWAELMAQPMSDCLSKLREDEDGQLNLPRIRQALQAAVRNPVMQAGFDNEKLACICLLHRTCEVLKQDQEHLLHEQLQALADQWQRESELTSAALCALQPLWQAAQQAPAPEPARKAAPRRK